MKIIAIGDLHGLDTWKYVPTDSADKIVFMGDYFDSFTIPAYKQIQNFIDILAFKQSFPDRVVLLLGNHEYHYLGGVGEQYAGFQTLHQVDIRERLHYALDNDLIQMCFKFDDVLFTHAGVTKTWCRTNSVDIDNIDDSINQLLRYKPKSFKFTSDRNFSNYGDDIEQSPIWVRPNSLDKNQLDNFFQVVGHTQQGTIHITPHVALIDAMPSNEYFIWNDGKKSVGVLKK
jgi:hypothetical protein